jgi:hypothetical protein
MNSYFHMQDTPAATAYRRVWVRVRVALIPPLLHALSAH